MTLNTLRGMLRGLFWTLVYVGAVFGAILAFAPYGVARIAGWPRYWSWHGTSQTGSQQEGPSMTTVKRRLREFAGWVRGLGWGAVLWLLLLVVVLAVSAYLPIR